MVLAILLKILAILGIILLGILGLVILILLIVCLVPLRYRVDLHGTSSLEDLKAQARITWLLRLLRVDLGYIKKEFSTRVRIAWKKISGDDRDAEPEKEEAKASRKEKEKAQSASDVKEKKEELKPEEKVPEEDKPAEEESEEEEKTEPQADAKAEEEPEPAEKPKEKKETKKKKEKKPKAARQKKERRFTFDRICGTIDEIRLDKDEVLAFFETKSHRKLMRHVIKRAKKLGKKLLPRTFKVTGELGFEDPYTTGLLAAGLSALYPRIEKWDLPALNFEEQAMDLDGFIKGKLKLGSFIWFALPLLADINLYRTIKDAKKLKKKLDRSAQIIKGGKAA